MVVCSFEMMCGVVIVTSTRVGLYVCIHVCWGIARFREHPSNVMAIALSRMWRLGASSPPNVAVVCMRICPALFPLRSSFAAEDWSLSDIVKNPPTTLGPSRGPDH